MSDRYKGKIKVVCVEDSTSFPVNPLTLEPTACCIYDRGALSVVNVDPDAVETIEFGEYLRRKALRDRLREKDQ